MIEERKSNGRSGEGSDRLRHGGASRENGQDGKEIQAREQMR